MEAEVHIYIKGLGFEKGKASLIFRRLRRKMAHIYFLILKTANSDNLLSKKWFLILRSSILTLLIEHILDIRKEENIDFCYMNTSTNVKLDLNIYKDIQRYLIPYCMQNINFGEKFATLNIKYTLRPTRRVFALDLAYS